MKKTPLLLLVCMLLLAGFGCSKKDDIPSLPPLPTDIDPQDAVTLSSTVTATNQSAADGILHIDSVTASADAWLVLYHANGAAPGTVVGHTAIHAGTATNVPLDLPPREADQEMYFLLVHEDSGERGVFEFPRADLPAKSATAVRVEVTR